MKGMLPAVAALFVTSMAAGCLGPSSTAVHDPPEETLPGSWVATHTCRYTCYEPTIAVSPFRRAFVTAGSDYVWRGDPADGGFVWTNVTPGEADAQIGDRMVDVAPSGRVFVTELVIGTAGAPEVRLMASDDNGTTWPIHHTFADGTLGQNMDRQWLTFGPTGQVAMIYKNQFEGLYIHWSADGGDSFSTGTYSTPQTAVGGVNGVEAYTSVVAGRPWIDADGYVMIPVFHHVVARVPQPLPSPVAGGLVVVQWAEGRPPTESPVIVDGKQPQGNFFPSLTRLGDVYWLAWRNYDGSLGLANSDSLVEWQAVVAPPVSISASPWLEVDAPGGKVHLAWPEVGSQGSRMVHAVGPGEWQVSGVGTLFGDEVRPGNTDFAHFALDGGAALFPLALPNGTGIEVVRVTAAL